MSCCDAVRATPRSVRDAVSALISDANAREAAARIRDECASLPEPDAVVPLFERLVESRRPSPSS